MDIKTLKSELISEGLLYEIIYFEEIDSTNTTARKENYPGNTLILTDNQTSGKGRFDRHWASSQGKDLTFTLVYETEIDSSLVQLINFYSSLLLYETLKNFFSKKDKINFTLKWPNDILLNGKKTAGILLDVRNIENKKKKFLIGVGINVNTEKFPEDLDKTATSLSIETLSVISREKFLIEFIKNFYSNIHKLNDKDLLMENWMKASGLKGRTIKIKLSENDTEQIATVTNIETDGALAVKFPNGEEKKFYSGIISVNS